MADYRHIAAAIRIADTGIDYIAASGDAVAAVEDAGARYGYADDNAPLEMVRDAMKAAIERGDANDDAGALLCATRDLRRDMQVALEKEMDG